MWHDIWVFLLKYCLAFFLPKKHIELNKFKSQVLYRSDLAGYLKDFQKSEVKQKLNFSDFSLYYSHDLCWSQFKGVYKDAFFTLILTHQAEETVNGNFGAIACIGFDVVGPSSILVKQIQGVSGQSDILKNFKWERMLVKMVMDWARNAGFQTVKIINSKSNGWYNQQRAESLFMKYDVTARRSGFKFDEKDQTYVKDLA